MVCGDEIYKRWLKYVWFKPLENSIVIIRVTPFIRVSCLTNIYPVTKTFFFHSHSKW